MPETPKQALLFTLLMCPVMVAGMSVYNMVLVHGLTTHALRMAAVSFPLALLVAFVVDFFVVARPAKALAGRIIRPQWSGWAKVVTVSSTMVVMMVLLMSGFGAVMHHGVTNQMWVAWAANIPTNFVVALPLQLIVAGPIVRFVFGSVMARRRRRQNLALAMA